MSKHIIAQRIDGVIYRDHENDAIEDEEFHKLISKKNLPPGVYVYHFQSDVQWARVLQFPVYEKFDDSFLVGLQVYMSEHGSCRRCNRVPADGLWQGRFPIIHNITGALLRTSPYKGYVCEQCAAQLEEDSGIKGQWVQSEKRSRKNKERKEVITQRRQSCTTTI